MKKRAYLVASALLAAGGPAFAEITLFGDARLGLGYGIRNNGEPNLDEVTNDAGVVVELKASDELRAISRVRFGVNMTGTTDSGLTFGATIRADNAPGGEGGDQGQRSGNVFVSGAFGTLTYGDTAGGDYQRVGNPIDNLSVTGLGDYNQLPFLSNGGGADNDALQFLADPDERPTVRYDYDFEGFGFSLSTNRDLTSVGVGGNYAMEFGDDASVSIGVGYYDFNEFQGRIDYYGDVTVPDGNQVSGAVTGVYGAFVGGIGYTSIDAGSAGQLDVLSVGAGAGFGPWSVRAYYSNVVSGDETFGTAFDGKDSYGASAAYDLGGGAAVRMGVARSYGADAVGDPDEASYFPEYEAATLADFGITLSF